MLRLTLDPVISFYSMYIFRPRGLCFWYRKICSGPTQMKKEMMNSSSLPTLGKWYVLVVHCSYHAQESFGRAVGTRIVSYLLSPRLLNVIFFFFCQAFVFLIVALYHGRKEWSIYIFRRLCSFLFRRSLRSRNCKARLAAQSRHLRFVSGSTQE